MHELSIAEALIEQVERELCRVGLKGPVRRVELRVGRLSGVHHESLRFAVELLAPGTVIEGAEIAINQPNARCLCSRCGCQTEWVEIPLRCPECGSEEVTIEGGRELLLEGIEVDDEPS